MPHSCAMSLSSLAPCTVLNPLWRTHSCVPRRHSCRRPAALFAMAEPTAYVTSKTRWHCALLPCRHLLNRVHTSVNAARRSACATTHLPTVPKGPCLHRIVPAPQTLHFSP